MFKVVDKRTFTHDVKVQIPVDGGFVEDTLKTTFNYIPTDRVEKFDLKTASGTTDFIRAIVAELHDLADMSGKPIPYNDAVRDQLISQPNIRLALTSHYLNAVTKVKEGN
jgi:hypothetical protein